MVAEAGTDQAVASSLELRRRSLALIFRSLVEEVGGHGRNSCQAAGPGGNACRNVVSVRPASASIPESALAGICSKLLAIRAATDPACISTGLEIDALACIADLEWCVITPNQLRSSNLGRELNNRFWREHSSSEVSARSRELVRNWRASVVVQASGLSESSDVTSLAVADSWAAAWAEVAAARCAQDIEAAAWSKFSERMCPYPGSMLCEWSRAYKGKIRFLATALRRPENDGLRKSALDGQVTGGFLVNRSEEEFLTAERRAEMQRHREEGLNSALQPQMSLDLFDANLACPFCNKIGARYGVFCDTGSVPIDGSAGHKRQKTKKRIHAECSACGERWHHDDGWHV